VDDTNVLHPARDARGAAGPAFDLSAAKLWRPRARPGSVRRSSLIDRLARSTSRRVVSVVAPAGYGKTTLLAQWAERNGQAFAWVSVDEADNDPKVLLTYVAEALNAVEPVGGELFDALASPATSVPGSVVPRLGRAFASMTSPVALVLDDAHLLRNSECRSALSVLADQAAALAGLARSNMLLDRRGVWYRYHHLFRDMLLAEVERQEPGMMTVLRRRAAAWCLTNGRPAEALEYSMAAEDVDQAAGLVQSLFLRTYRQGRVTTCQRWLRWLDDRDGIEGHPVIAVDASIIATATGRPVEAERWADAVDRWQDQDQDPARPADPVAEAWAVLMRALLCRRGIEQMRADADDAAQRYAAANIVMPAAPFSQGIARVLSGDLDGGDAFFADAISIGETGAPDALAAALCQRSLVAMARGRWDQAEALAGEAAAVRRRTGIEDSYASPLVSAVQARVAMHRGDTGAARRELVIAQRLRPLLTYAIPYLAVQARIELTRVHLALADVAGARVLMREIDELCKRRPGLGTLVGQAEELRDRLAKVCSSTAPGASALTGAELRLLPMLCTHLSLPEIGADLFLSPHTIKSQAYSLYRKLEVTSRSQAVARARELGLLGG
jgi:LuxR family maltose regulon positive regulatory protein